MDSFGICLLSQIPVRETISHASQMVTQLLFGETLTIEDKYSNWFKICSDFDRYHGWIDEKQIQLISKDEYQTLCSSNNEVFITDPIARIERAADHAFINLGMGSRLAAYKDGGFTVNDNLYRFSGLTTPIGKESAKSVEIIPALIQSGKHWMFTPYLWGGKSIFGTDCSGFIQTLFRMYGKSLPRDAKDQALCGNMVNFFDEAKEGDLLFFDNENEEIVHVGIYLGTGKILHASGMVKIDIVDHEGIFRQETGTYSHHLRIIRRVFDA